MRSLAGAALAAALWASPTPLMAQATTPTPDDPREANLSAYVELLRSDVRSQKAAFLTEMMEFTDTEDAAFWPIYREYDAELTKVADERLAMIREYATTAGTPTATQAETLGRKAIDIERRRDQVLEKYYEKVKSAISPVVALRFLQVEHQMLLIIDLQISAALPVAK